MLNFVKRPIVLGILARHLWLPMFTACFRLPETMTVEWSHFVT